MKSIFDIRDGEPIIIEGYYIPNTPYVCKLEQLHFIDIYIEIDNQQDHEATEYVRDMVYGLNPSAALMHEVGFKLQEYLIRQVLK